MGDPDRTLATLGPLTFTASCTSDAGRTHAVPSARSNADAWLIGNTLRSGDSAILAVNTLDKNCRFFGTLIDDAG